MLTKQLKLRKYHYIKIQPCQGTTSPKRNYLFTVYQLVFASHTVKGILQTNKEYLIKANERLPGLLNCPGTPCVLLDHKQWLPFFCAHICIPKHTNLPKLSSFNSTHESQHQSTSCWLIRWISLQQSIRPDIGKALCSLNSCPTRAYPKLYHIYHCDAFWRQISLLDGMYLASCMLLLTCVQKIRRSGSKLERHEE